MKKNKNLISISIIFLTIISILGYNKLKEISNHSSQAIQAVPNNAAIIVKVNNWSKSWADLQQTEIWSQVSNTKKWKDIISKINSINSVLDTSTELQSLVKEKDIFLSIHPSINSHSLFLSSGLKKNKIEVIEKYFSKLPFETRAYDNVNIYQMENGWNICHHKDILIFSSSNLLIEQGIRQLNNQLSLLDNEAFIAAQNTESSFAQAHIYINHSEFSNLLSENTDFSKTQKTQMSRWGDWAELDLKIKNRNLIFGGFTVVADSTNYFLTTLINQAPQSFETSIIAPNNTKEIVTLGLSNFKLYYEKYAQYLAKHNNLYDHNKWLNSINKKYDIDFLNTYSAIFNNEISAIKTHSSNGKTDFFIFIKSEEQSYELLKFISDKDLAFKEELYRNFKINKLEIKNINSELFGPYFNTVKENYFTWINGYIVFANSVSSLTTLINNVLSEKTLNNDLSYQNFKNNISQKSNFLYYQLPSAIDWKNQLRSNWNPYFENEKWTNINGFLYQLTSNKDLFYTNSVISYEPKQESKSRQDWTVSLDAALQIEPKFCTNHYNNQKEIFVQDISKNIYLISASGTKLWSKKIGGNILGEVNQIDFYKNKKLQIIFNTQDSLYIIDRLGNYLENTPYALNTRATSGHLLLDYDSNRKYRILIPSEGNNIENYDKYGNLVKGWEFENMSDEIFPKMDYFVKDGKDYIIVLDKDGNAKAIGRNGKTRIEFEKIPLANTFYLDKQNALIYSTDDSGNVWQTTFDGTQTKVKSSDIGNHYFLAGQLNNDELMELIISDQNETSCFQLENKLFSVNYGSNINPKLIQIKDDLFFGISSGESVFLFDKEGEIHPGTPVYGQEFFNCIDVDKDGQANLIVGSNNLINNYTIE